MMFLANSAAFSQRTRRLKALFRRQTTACFSARSASYFCCVGGVAGFGAGCVLTGSDLIPCSTELGPPCLVAYIDRVMEVSMKATADQVVALESAVAAPRGPKAVWLPCPPNAAEMSPLLPLCSSTTRIMKKQTRMWTAVTR